jgi:putative inorganic carbon (HCO3(-)) transporter
MSTFSSTDASFLKPPSRAAGKFGLLICAGLVILAAIFLTGITKAIVGALALCLLGVMLFKPDAATLVVIVALYTNLGPVLTKNHNVPQIVAGSFSLLLGIPLVIYLVVRKERIITNRVVYAMLAFAAVMVISTFFSEYPVESLLSTCRYLLEGVLLYFLVLNTVRTQATLRKVIWAIIFAGTFLSVLACYQALTGNTTNTFGGFALPSGVVGTGEQGWGGQQIVDLGAGGPLGEKNHFGQILVMVIPLALSCLWTERSRKLRWLALALCVAVLGGVIFTYSRGSFVSLVVVAFLMVYLGRLKLRHLILTGVGASLIVLLVFPNYAYRISTLAGLTNPVQGDSSMQGHATVNLAGIKIFLDHPVLGVGPGQVQMYTMAYSNAMGEAPSRLVVNQSVQNTFLQQMDELGVIGFAVFVTILWITIRPAWQASRSFRANRSYATVTLSCVLLAVLGYLTQDLFVQLAWERYFWLMMALCAVATRLAFEEPTDSEGVPESLTSPAFR